MMLKHLHNNRFKIAIYLVALVTICDQLSKSWIINNVAPHRYLIVTPFLNFVHVQNTGVTFGFMNDIDEDYVAYGLIAVATLVVFLLGRWLWRTSSATVSVGLGFIIGGAIGNVIDRIRIGSVTDFLDFYWGNYHWFAFNIADAAIVTGVGLLLLDSLIRGR